MTDIDRISAKVDALKQRHWQRDQRTREVAAIRRGDMRAIAPAFFSEANPRAMVANQIDVIARHASAALSPLPMVYAPQTNSNTQAGRDRADLRSKIASSYIHRSNLAARMQQGADQFYCYGLIVASIEPYKGAPAIVIEDSAGFYPLWDRFGNTMAVARVFNKTLLELQAEYPEHKAALKNQFKNEYGQPMTGTVQVTKWADKDNIVLYISNPGIFVLADIPNPLGECPYVAVMRPGLDDEIRGALDDVVWVQIAKHVMENYLMRSVEQTVNAPWAVPNDVTEIEFGPGQVVRTNEPDKIRRIVAGVDNAAWAAPERMKNEIEYGAITPPALNGSIDANVVTGKGVQQLMAGYSQQIAMAQQTLVLFFQQAIYLCFKMDEMYWPNEERSIRGTLDGKPYEETYVPSKDIAGNCSINVEYGGVAGLDPNRALVFLLQGQAARLFSKDYVLRHLPLGDLNVTDEQYKIQLEELRDSLLQGLSGTAQNMGAAIQGGLDPWAFIGLVVEAIDALEKKKPLDDVLKKLLEPKPQPTPQEQVAAGVAANPLNGGPAGLPGGLEVAPGAAATQGPGGRPDRSMMFAGTNGAGNPNLQAGVSRMLNT